jgi:hypothetical protein
MRELRNISGTLEVPLEMGRKLEDLHTDEQGPHTLARELARIEPIDAVLLEPHDLDCPRHAQDRLSLLRVPSTTGDCAAP